MKKQTMVISVQVMVTAIIIIAGFLLLRPASRAVPAVRWRVATTAPLRFSPAIDNGILYAGNDDGVLYAVNATTGIIRWKVRTGGAIRSTPAISGDLVYILIGAEMLYAIDISTGTTRWRIAMNNPSSPAVEGATIYVGSGDSCLYALRAQDGLVRWRQKTGGAVGGSAAVSGETVYIESGDGYLYSLSTADGSERWRVPMGTPDSAAVVSTPGIAAGMILTGSRSPFLRAFDSKTGVVRWTSAPESIRVEWPVETAGGSAYLTSRRNCTAYAFDARTGEKKWANRLNAMPLSAPAYGDGIVIVRCRTAGTGSVVGTGSLCGFDAVSGDELWNISAVHPGSAPVVWNGRAYLTGLDGVITAFDLNGTPDPNLAYEKKAAASSSKDSSTIPARAIDDDASTQWCAGRSGRQWYQVDLDSCATVRDILLHWRSPAHRQYRLLTSADGVLWESVVLGSGGRGKTDVVDVPPMTCRFIRIEFDNPGAVEDYALCDLEAYGLSDHGGGPEQRRAMLNGMEQNFLNPLQLLPGIPFTLPVGDSVMVSVVDGAGNRVATLATGDREAGNYTCVFYPDSLNRTTYYARLETSQKIIMKRLLLSR